MVNNTTNKITYLDGLRGLAAVIVLIWHFSNVFYPATLNGDPKISHLPFAFDAWLFNSPVSFFYNGDFAVSIFFVLSGYVLTKAYFVKKDKDILIKRAIARYPRLLIPSAVSMLFVFVLLQTGAYKVFYLDNGANNLLHYTEKFSFENLFIHTLNNIFFDIVFGDYHTSKIENAVLWTMGIEFKGS